MTGITIKPKRKYSRKSKVSSVNIGVQTLPVIQENKEMDDYSKYEKLIIGLFQNEENDREIKELKQLISKTNNVDLSYVYKQEMLRILLKKSKSKILL